LVISFSGFIPAAQIVEHAQRIGGLAEERGSHPLHGPAPGLTDVFEFAFDFVSMKVGLGKQPEQGDYGNAVCKKR